MSSSLRAENFIPPGSTPPATTYVPPGMYSAPPTTFSPFYTGEEPTSPEARTRRQHQIQLLLAGALVLGVLRSLRRDIPYNTEDSGILLSQYGNKSVRDLDVGMGKPLGWWLDRGNQTRGYIVKATAQMVGEAFGPVLGGIVSKGVNAGLQRLTSPAFYRSLSRIDPDLMQSSQMVGRVWAKQYAEKLGAGLGDKSADGLLVSLSTLQRSSVAERTAWQIVENAAGLPHGEALSVTQVAINRLGLMMGSRRPITGKDLAEDVAKLYLSRRARRIAENESQVAYNFGVQIAMMNAQKKGYLPPYAEKVWVTAIDERVCPVCAPMDSVAVKVDDPFLVRPHHGVLSHEVKLWVPPAHPKCRCRIVPHTAIRHGIITRTARYSRDERGRARLVSQLSDIVRQGPSWAEEDLAEP